MKRLFSTRYSDTSVSIALLILRIAMGGLIIPHGYDKLVHFGTKAEKFADPLGIGHPTSLVLVIFAEFFCGILVMVGLMTRLACIPLIVVMSVALFYSHHGQVFSAGEKAALFLAGFLCLLFTGPGKISTDRLIGR